jgi:hypothetical protein
MCEVNTPFVAPQHFFGAAAEAAAAIDRGSGAGRLKAAAFGRSVRYGGLVTKP